MSTVSATVTKGKTWTPDVAGKVLLTPDDLNLTGTPAVSVPLTNRVAAEDLQALAVTLDKLAALSVSLPKLATDASAYLRKLALTPVDDGDGTGKMNIQVKDANGNNLTGTFLLRVWISESIYGFPTAVTTFTASGEMVILTVLANGHLLALTGNDGTLVLNINADGGAAAVRYVMASHQDQVFYEKLILTTP